MPIANWCREHNLIWGAEKPTWRPAQFWRRDEPSTDAGHRRIARAARTVDGAICAPTRAPPWPPPSNAAREERALRMFSFAGLGRDAARPEMGHSIGWRCRASIASRRTRFMRLRAGLDKHDAAPSFFAENPYWAHFRFLADYVGRLSLAMSAGRERARLALVFPTEMIFEGGERAPQARCRF